MVLFLVFGLLSGCTEISEKEEQVEEEQADSSAEDSASEEINQAEKDMIAVLELFTERCGFCHGSWPPDLGENLCETIINQSSTQVSSMNYVTPFDLEDSYLWHKINGTAGDFGDYPSQMPASSEPLSIEEVGLIQRWIEMGAKCE